MEHARSLRTLTIGVALVCFSVSQANAQATITPQQEVKKEVSIKKLLPLLDFIFSNGVQLKDSTETKVEQPIARVRNIAILERTA